MLENEKSTTISTIVSSEIEGMHTVDVAQNTITFEVIAETVQPPWIQINTIIVILAILVSITYYYKDRLIEVIRTIA